MVNYQMQNSKRLDNFAREFYKLHKNDGDNINFQVDNFAEEFYALRKEERDHINSQIKEFSEEFTPIHEQEHNHLIKKFEDELPHKPQIDYLDVFDIAHSEERYTQFLEWLLNPQSSHQSEKPLQRFLKNIVNNKFNFALNGVDVKAEKEEKGKRPDLQIEGKVEGEEFLCVIEIKIHAREGKDQTKKYYKQYKNKKPHTFFIFLTLNKEEPKKSGDGQDGFKPECWDNFIKKVIKPFLAESNEQQKCLLEAVIYNLKTNKLTRSGKEFLEESKYNDLDNNLKLREKLLELKEKLDGIKNDIE